MSATERAKVVARIFGGLGNQLFCYAAARRMSLIEGAELVIDDISGFVHDHTYHRQYQLDHFNIPCRKATPSERLEPYSRIRRYIKRQLSQRHQFVTRNYIRQAGIDFDARLLQVKPHGTVYIEGYWQSEGYFKDVETTIRLDLQITPPSDAINLAVAMQINVCTAVAVHVRFFDEPHENNVNNAPGDYYHRAIETMEQLVPSSHYFIFSDQPEAARARIPLPDARVTLVAHNRSDENAYADLWLMTHCQHFIIANSTFSWWGAWLAGNKEKKIITPGKITGSVTAWGFTGLIPATWQVLEIEQ